MKTDSRKAPRKHILEFDKLKFLNSDFLVFTLLMLNLPRHTKAILFCFFLIWWIFLTLAEFYMKKAYGKAVGKTQCILFNFRFK